MENAGRLDLGKGFEPQIARFVLCLRNGLTDLNQNVPILVSRLYVPADFDTIENAFSGAKPPKKAYNKGLSRSVFDFESPFCLYSIGV